MVLILVRSEVKVPLESGDITQMYSSIPKHFLKISLKLIQNFCSYFVERRQTSAGGQVTPYLGGSC